ncbi:hypothetical protein GCM10019016_105650 [Streptomyces prasinosporus]|uniref:Uncharacterized protein n=1 Tax=Streptomyces prasinosporus TaxID=68256 RepID=A0ABP6U708_9ACTN
MQECCVAGRFVVGVAQELAEVVGVAAEEADEGLQDVVGWQDAGFEEGGDGFGGEDPAAGDGCVAGGGAAGA